MNIINTYSNKRFTLNGVQYLKNYISRVSGNNVQVYNCYDNADVLCEYQIYSDYVVNGITFGSAVALQAALIDVIYSRGTLGNDVEELIQDNKRLVKDVTIATSDTDSYILDRINELPLYNVDEFTLVSFRCSDGEDRNIIYNTVGVGKGSYGDGGTQLTQENLLKIYEYTPGTDQNNIGKKINLGDFTTTNPITEARNKINTSLGFTVGEKETPVIMNATRYIYNEVDALIPAYKYTFLFLGGKGTWGNGGVAVGASMIYLLLTENLQPDDIQPSDTNNIIALGDIGSADNFLDTVNAETYDFTGTEIQNYFTYTVGENLSLVMFIGAPGTYGAAGEAFTESDFAYITDSETPPLVIPTLEQVTQAGAISLKPITIQSVNPTTGAPIEKTVYSARGQSFQPEGGNWTNFEIEEGTGDGLTRTLPASGQDEVVAYRSDFAAYVPKSYEGSETFSNTGTLNALTWGSKRTMRWVAADNSSLTINSIIDPNVYPGKEYILSNETLNTDPNVWSSIFAYNNASAGTGIKFNFPGATPTLTSSYTPTNYGQKLKFYYSAESGMMEISGVSMNDVSRMGSLPDDLILWANAATAYQLRFVVPGTTQVRTVNLSQLVTITRPSMAFNEIVRNGNDLFLFSSNNSTSSTQLPYIMVLRNCRIVNGGGLVWDSVTQALINVNYKVHGTVFNTNNGFIYGVTASGNSVIKINPYDLTDQKTYSFPSGDNVIGMNAVDFYKENIYTIVYRGTSPDLYQRIVKLDENLTGYTTIAEYADKGNGQPFIIANEKMYVVKAYDGEPKKFSVNVYSLSGTLLTSGPEINITNTQTSSTAFEAHWMTFFNGKLIITSGTTPIRHMARVDAVTLALDGANSELQFSSQVTDDNTIGKDGFLYIFNEGTNNGDYGTHKIKYNDFTNKTLISSIASAGSLGYKWYSKEAIAAAATAATNLTYTASPTAGVVASDTGTDAAIPLADTTNAGLLSPGDKTKLNNTSGTNSGDNAVNSNSNSYTDTQLANFDRRIHLDLDTYSSTATTSEQVLKTFSIATAYQDKGLLRFYAKIAKAGTNAACTFKIYKSASSTFSVGTATLLATAQLASTQLASSFWRDILIKSASSWEVWNTFNQVSTESGAGAVAYSSVSNDNTVTQYVHITVTLGNTGDTASVRFVEVLYAKQ